MKIGYLTSSVSSKCVICKKIVSTYKTAKVGSIEVSIAVCDEHLERVNLSGSVENLLKAVRSVVTQQ